MVMASARVMLAASRLPQRGRRYRPTVFRISSAVRCLAAAGRERKASASAAKVMTCWLAGLGVNAGNEVADGGSGERPRLGETDIGIAAQGDADRLRPPRHASHDEERDHATIGDPDAEGRPRRVPVDGSLTGGGGLEALEKSVGKDGALCHDGVQLRKKRGQLGATWGLRTGCVNPCFCRLIDVHYKPTIGGAF